MTTGCTGSTPAATEAPDDPPRLYFVTIHSALARVPDHRRVAKARALPLARDALTMSRRRICFVTSSTMTAKAFLADHTRALSRTYDVHLVVNADPSSAELSDFRHATLHRACIERAIAPLKDISAVAQLTRILLRGRFAAAHSITPKAGLITVLAALAARVPVRVHTFTGQVWTTRRGNSRHLLKTMDRIIARLNTHVLVDSPSQRDFLRAERVLSPHQGEVLGNGSVCGVDSTRFRPDPRLRQAVRAELAIPETAIIFLFVGRLTRDKGVLELAAAFNEVARERDDLYLILIGPDENALGQAVRAACATTAARLRLVGYSLQPEKFMAAADVFCLPSHREGFGAVIIEAAAAGLPAIGSRIYGIVDAIEERATGLLVEPGDVGALATAMRCLANDEHSRLSLGAAARARALRIFTKEISTTALVDFYQRVLPAGKIARRPST